MPVFIGLAFPQLWSRIGFNFYLLDGNTEHLLMCLQVIFHFSLFKCWFKYFIFTQSFSCLSILVRASKKNPFNFEEVQFINCSNAKDFSLYLFLKMLQFYHLQWILTSVWSIKFTSHRQDWQFALTQIISGMKWGVTKDLADIKMIIKECILVITPYT